MAFWLPRVMQMFSAPTDSPRSVRSMAAMFSRSAREPRGSP
jgi:hypothetical protein